MTTKSILDLQSNVMVFPSLSTGQAQPAAAAPERHDHRSRTRRSPPAPRSTATPSPASGSLSLLTSRRSAGRAGSSPRGVTTPTTARAPVRSRWGEASKPPTTPRCAPSCTRSSSRATKWERPAACPTDSSPSACCTSTKRRTWF